MPPFPGMGYPLVPGYEAAGEVVEAGARDAASSPATHVFVPGANCYDGALRPLRRRRAPGWSRQPTASRAIDAAHGPRGRAAGAGRHRAPRHGRAPDKALPELIVGHGVLGRLLARLTIAAGAPAPTVWEIDPGRRAGAEGYEVIAPR